jgi:hypothetical protein
MFADLLPQWSRVLPVNLCNIFKKCPSFYGTHRYTTIDHTSPSLVFSWVRRNQSIVSHYISSGSSITFSSQPHLKLNSVARVRERTIPTERPPLVGEVSCVVSSTDPYGRIQGFLDQSRYFFFHVAPQLYSRGWVNPVPDPLLIRKSGSSGNRARTSGSVARNCVQKGTKQVSMLDLWKKSQWVVYWKREMCSVIVKQKKRKAIPVTGLGGL